MRELVKLIFCFNFCSYFAQPIIEAHELKPIDGDFFTINTSNSQVPVAGAGANAVWNLSGLTNIANVRTHEYFDLSLANANLEEIEVVLGGVSQTYRKFNYTTTKCDLISYSFYDTTVYDLPKLTLQFPLTFNDSLASQYHSNTTDIAGNFQYQTDGSVTYKVDGYGTLITPTAIFNEVLRVELIDSFVNITSSSTSGLYVSEEIRWFRAGFHHELASYRTLYYNGVKQGSTFTYLEEYLSSLVIEEKSPILLYPNPSQGEFVIDLPQLSVSDKIELTDINGTNINMNCEIKKGKAICQISDISPGVYFVNITDENFSQFVRKIIIE